VRNLSELILDRAQRRPDAGFGVVGDVGSLAEAVRSALDAVGALAEVGVGAGSRVAMIGPNSVSYLRAWLTLVLAGAEVALVNPEYPRQLLTEMLGELGPQAVVWVGRDPDTGPAPEAVHLDASALAEGRISVDGRDLSGSAPASPPGLDRDPLDVAGYMHTSGTTGPPKFCEQTHEYFLRLGRFIADSMCISAADTVFAPLPMYHINPLGYGVVGGLTGGAGIVGLERFSARGFWPAVREIGASVLILHAPPVEILKRATTGDDSAGHRVSRVFLADDEFIEEHGIPLCFSAYGSTEAGGLSHMWAWRNGDRPELAEGMSRYGGRVRHDAEWTIDDTGQILVRGRRDGVLFSGYRRRAGLERPFDESGWFATGDLGRIDEAGNLVFIERRSESIRVMGEYVPIGYVEQRFAAVPGVDDAAIWRSAGELVDDEIVLYVVADEIPVDGVAGVRATLPRFMQPARVARVTEIPRDAGVGKVRRRLLDESRALEVIVL
jgi:crotonobetaine/carnitine-CoA ligase